MIRRIRQWWQRRRPPSPASQAAFDAATREPFAAVATETARMRDLLMSPLDTPNRIEDIAGAFGTFARAMEHAVNTGDERMISFIGRFLNDVDDRQRDRFAALNETIQRLSLDMQEQRRAIADLHQALAYKSETDERRFQALEGRQG